MRTKWKGGEGRKILSSVVNFSQLSLSDYFESVC